jgi:hypothetical protein
MFRTLVAAVLLSVGSAFAPIASTLAPLALTPAALPVAPDVISAANSLIIASSENDFGGYFFPIAGLGLLSAFITFLSPPLKDD